MKYYWNLASAVYCHNDVNNQKGEIVERFIKDIDKYAVFHDELLQTVGIVTLGKKRKEIVMVFRGTVNVVNVAACITTMNVKSDYAKNQTIRIHQGFYMSALSLYTQMVTAVGYLRNSKPEYMDYKIVICGHSLGGAMGRITQFFLNNLKQFPGAKYEVYTYGEPRSGNKCYSDYLNSLSDVSVRVTNKGDVVPHLPPTNFLSKLHPFFGDAYLHVKVEYWFDRKGGSRFCNQSVYEDRKCSMSLSPFYGITEHSEYFDEKGRCADNTEIILSNATWFANLATFILRIPQVPTRILDFTAGGAQFKDTVKKSSWAWYDYLNPFKYFG